MGARAATGRAPRTVDAREDCPSVGNAGCRFRLMRSSAEWSSAWTGMGPAGGRVLGGPRGELIAHAVAARRGHRAGLVLYVRAVASLRHIPRVRGCPSRLRLFAARPGTNEAPRTASELEDGA